MSALKIKRNFSFEGGIIITYLYAILIFCICFKTGGGAEFDTMYIYDAFYAILLRGRVVSFRTKKYQKWRSPRYM